MASSYKVENRSQQSIVGIMDSNREIHALPPLGTAIFVKANPFDRPTIKIYIDSNADGVPDSGQIAGARKAGYFEAIVASGDWVWTGTALKASDEVD